jgi:hypothetical protein
VALRRQLTVYKRTSPRPKLHTTDRLFWAGLAGAWTGWRQALVIVAPDTDRSPPRPLRPRHPPAIWTAQQIVDAFPNESAPAYLVRDRDRLYG